VKCFALLTGAKIVPPRDNSEGYSSPERPAVRCFDMSHTDEALILESSLASRYCGFIQTHLPSAAAANTSGAIRNAATIGLASRREAVSQRAGV
jgi:hypothetical protein